MTSSPSILSFSVLSCLNIDKFFALIKRLSTVGAFNLSSQLDINVTKREKNIDQNAAAFILQGAIDFLSN